jgi:hypothetical protein
MKGTLKYVILGLIMTGISILVLIESQTFWTWLVAIFFDY